MARLSQDKINKIKDKYNVKRVWSWSKLDCFITSPYEYFLKYILHKNEDRNDCAYVYLGTIAHDTLDAFYEGEIEYKDMIDRFKDGWMTTIDIANLKLDRNDEEKDAKLKAKYKENVELFFRNHVPYKYKLMIEKPAVANIKGNVFIGYIDGIYKDDDDVYHILDFKTSSKYVGKSLEEHSGQLTIYAMAIMQAGVPLDKIKACFNFLKYCTVKYEQANGTIKTRDIERCKLGESLQTNARMWLKKLGYEDSVDDYLGLMLDTNSIEVMPEEVKAKYTIEDCHVYIPLDQKSIDNWTDYIVSTIKDICCRENDYKDTGSEMAFWDSDESVEAQSYYFATLSCYSASLHKPYQKYLERLEEKQMGLDIFSGVGSANNDELVSVPVTNNAETARNNDIDLSWLDSI